MIFTGMPRTLSWESRQLNAELGDAVTSLSWLADDVNEEERRALWFLNEVARTDTKLAKATVTIPWFTDGLDEEEAALMAILASVVSTSPELYADMLRTRPHSSQNRYPQSGRGSEHMDFSEHPLPCGRRLVDRHRGHGAYRRGASRNTIPHNRRYPSHR